MKTCDATERRAARRTSCAFILVITISLVALLVSAKGKVVPPAAVDARSLEPNHLLAGTTLTDSYRNYLPLTFSKFRALVWRQIALDGRHVTEIRTHPRESNTLYAVTADQRGLFRSVDSGHTWQQIGNNLPQDIEVTHIAVDAHTSARIYITTPTHPRFYYSNDSGQTWHSGGDIPLIPRILVAHSAIPEHLFLGTGAWDVFGGGGWLLKSDDGGLNWTSVITNQVLANTIAATAGDSSLVYVGGNGLYKSNNGGEYFAQLTSGVPFSQVKAVALHPTHPLTVYVSTDAGSVYKTNDGGSVWTLWSVSPYVAQKLLVDTRSPETQYMVADNCAGVFSSKNEGVNWQDLNAGLTDVCVSDLVTDETFTYFYAATSDGIWSLTLQEEE